MTAEEETRIVERVCKRLAELLQQSVAMQGQPEPEYLTPDQVQQKFGIKPATVRLWVRQGKVKGKPGRPCLVKLQDLRQLISG